MSEADKIETEEIVEIEETDDKKVGVGTEEMPDSSGNPPDKGPGMVKGFMKKLGIIKSEEPEEKEGADIPEEFSKAALELGYSEEDIRDLAEKLTDEELIEMIPTLYPDEEQEPDTDSATEEKTTLPPKADSLDKDKVASLKDEIRDEIRKEFQQELDGLKESLGEVRTETESRNQTAMLNTINSAFDAAAEEHEIFGKTDELLKFPAGDRKGEVIPTTPQMKARSEVFDKAGAFMAVGAKVDEAMQDAFLWYKGKHLEKDVHRKVIRDFKKQETKLSAKRSGKETIPSFENEEERQIAFIKQQAEKLGIKLAEE